MKGTKKLIAKKPMMNPNDGVTNEKTAEKTEFALMEAIPKNRWSHSHHLFIFHGRRMCKARKPECDLCPIREECNYYNSTQRND